MIDKSQTAEQVQEALWVACQGAVEPRLATADPSVLVYAIPKCETPGEIGFDGGSVACKACGDTGYVPVRVIPEATLRRLAAVVGRVLRIEGDYPVLDVAAEAKDDPLIAQLIKELD